MMIVAAYFSAVSNNDNNSHNGDNGEYGKTSQIIMIMVNMVSPPKLSFIMCHQNLLARRINQNPGVLGFIQIQMQVLYKYKYVP